jgi:hypothetical protein
MKSVLKKTFGVLGVIGCLIFAAVALVGGLIAKGVWFMICVVTEG